MQLYRGMDIGTAKLTAAERRGVPHHLLDVWDVRVAATVADYQRLARAALARPAAPAAGRPCWSAARGSTCGRRWTTSTFPGTDPAVRARLEARAGRARARPRCTPGCARLDPAAAAAILPSNGRRIVRALEVIELTGRPFTAGCPRRAPTGAGGAARAGLDRPTLDAADRGPGRPRCGQHGLVDEVAALAAAGLRDGRTAAGRSATRRCCATSTAEWTEAAGPGRDGARHPAVRPAPGLLVPPGPAGGLAGRRGARPGRRVVTTLRRRRPPDSGRPSRLTTRSLER